MSLPSVAAIVPVYNRPRYVLDALESILSQTRLPEKLVIIDDGSTDATPRALEGWTEAGRSRAGIEIALVLEPANHGVAWSRNRAAQVAAGVDLLAYLDSDDLWPADYLERVTSLFGGHTEIVAATADRLDSNLCSGRRTLRRFDRLPESTTRRLFMNGPPGTPNTVFRAGAFNEAGGYDERHPCLEDYELMLRLSRLGAWAHLPGAPVVVRRDLETAPGDAPHLSRRDAAWRM